MTAFLWGLVIGLPVGALVGGFTVWRRVLTRFVLLRAYSPAEFADHDVVDRVLRDVEARN